MVSLLFPLYYKLHYVMTQTKYRLSSFEQFQSIFKEVFLSNKSFWHFQYKELMAWLCIANNTIKSVLIQEPHSLLFL